MILRNEHEVVMEYMMKLLLIKCLLGFCLVCLLWILASPESDAQGISFQAGRIRIGIDSTGKINSLYDSKLKKDYLLPGYSMPLLVMTVNGSKINPVSMSTDKASDIIVFNYPDGVVARVEITTRPTHLVARLVEVTGAAPSMIEWGPIYTTITQTIGDVIAVVRDDSYAIGMQALNVQTSALAGPVKEIGSYVSGTAYAKEGGIRDSKIAIFGCQAKDALNYIGKIEIAEGLPHPVLSGKWIKITPSATNSYLISSYTEAALDSHLKLTQKLGFKYLYHPEPFKTWGHFDLDPAAFPEGDASLKRCSQRAAKLGIGLGVHTLTAFITNNDAYVTPIPDPRLARLGSSKLSASITSSSSEIPVADKEPFTAVQNWGWNRLFAVIGTEIVEYTGVSSTNPPTLTGCVRGALGTTSAPHNKDADIGRLATHAYQTFYPAIEGGMLEEMTDRIVRLVNNCDIKQISFDGLEGLSDYGYPYSYTRNLFVKQCYDKFDHYVINDASNLMHFLWHYNTRMNWGEPWNKPMRETSAGDRFANQPFFTRNLLPPMLGWFQFRTAGDGVEATSLDGVEWMLSKAAGFGAGFALVSSPEIFVQNGQGDVCAAVIERWERARLANAFSQDQRARLRLQNSEWHLEENGNNRWKLWSLKFTSDLAFAGASGTIAHWNVINPYKSQNAQCVIRVVSGSGITNPSIEANGENITFPVALLKDQYLVCEADGKARVCDKNWNTLRTLSSSSHMPRLLTGDNAVSFTGIQTDAKVMVTFKMASEPEDVKHQ